MGLSKRVKHSFYICDRCGRKVKSRAGQKAFRCIAGWCRGTMHEQPGQA